ncbi:ATP-binding protein [Adlercreutzia equolifaciens]|uniref:ATP-binding protein n=1 Tax=Adlercreutzia equolifaciens TaxID=446660 RepID=UPI003AB1A796
MLRKIIHIDEDKCTGCGLCVDACHEGAIAMVDGKARLVRDDYCDGLGDCLPSCPTDAISFVEREAAPYDEAAVAAHLATRNNNGMSGSAPAAPHGGCPGSRSRSLDGAPAPAASAPATRTAAPAADNADPLATIAAALPNRLAQWPCQIKLVPVQAPYYQGRGLLIAADCTAFACASFHERFMNGNVTIIGCPKLDEGSYTDKLAAIIAANDIASVTVARMEVPCCGGLERAAAEACAQSGKDIPFEVVTFAVNGDVIS